MARRPCKRDVRKLLSQLCRDMLGYAQSLVGQDVDYELWVAVDVALSSSLLLRTQMAFLQINAKL